MTQQNEFHRGDIVMLKSGHTKMEVVRVAGKEIQCRYPDAYLDQPYRAAKDYMLIQACGPRKVSGF